VLDFSQYFDRSCNLSTDAPGVTTQNNAGLSVKPLQISDVFWCERKNHKKRSTTLSQNRKINDGKPSTFPKSVQNFLDTTPCPMETMARNYLCVRFQVKHIFHLST
jgi:hypothetical protein